jgi:hypothetical protein
VRRALVAVLAVLAVAVPSPVEASSVSAPAGFRVDCSYRQRPGGPLARVLHGQPCGASVRQIGGSLWDRQDVAWTLLPGAPLRLVTAVAVCRHTADGDRQVRSWGPAWRGAVSCGSHRRLESVTFRVSTSTPPGVRGGGS